MLVNTHVTNVFCSSFHSKFDYNQLTVSFFCWCKSFLWIQSLLMSLSRQESQPIKSMFRGLLPTTMSSTSSLKDQPNYQSKEMIRDRIPLHFLLQQAYPSLLWHQSFQTIDTSRIPCFDTQLVKTFSIILSWEESLAKLSYRLDICFRW